MRSPRTGGVARRDVAARPRPGARRRVGPRRFGPQHVDPDVGLRAVPRDPLGRRLANRAFFDANIFYPAPLTLAYSEHLIAQAIQIFPVYLLTANPILCYNLLFLSTFVLSGLGIFLLVRELTGNATAAFVAGLLFAFAPYRVPQSSHLQVLSSQWMPFALYGLRRYFDTTGRARWSVRRWRSWLQNLSSGYYLLYFTPFAAAYAVWEMWRRGLLARRAHVGAAAVAAVVVVIATDPVRPALCTAAQPDADVTFADGSRRDFPPTFTRTRRLSASSGSGETSCRHFRSPRASSSQGSYRSCWRSSGSQRDSSRAALRRARRAAKARPTLWRSVALASPPSRMLPLRSLLLALRRVTIDLWGRSRCA